MFPDDPTEETLTLPGPTPNGGVSATAYYQDADGNPAPKSRAVGVEVVERDAEGRDVQRTYAEIPGRGGSGPA